MKNTVQRTPKVFSAKNPAESTNFGIEINFYKLRYLILLLLLTAGLFLAKELPFLRLKNIEIEGDNDEQVTRSLESLKGRSIFNRRISSLLKEINQTNYTVNQLKCRLGLPDTLKCHLAMKRAIIYWRQEPTQKIYKLDEEGVIFEEISALPKGVILIVDWSDSKIEIGQRLLNHVFIDNFLLLNKLLTEAQISCESFSMSALSDFITANVNGFSVDGRQFDKKLKILFNRAGSIENQMVSLEVLLREKHQLINEQVDLRVPGVAYFK